MTWRKVFKELNDREIYRGLGMKRLYKGVIYVDTGHAGVTVFQITGNPTVCSKIIKTNDKEIIEIVHYLLCHHCLIPHIKGQ